jgi:hypothetical protein
MNDDIANGALSRLDGMVRRIRFLDRAVAYVLNRIAPQAVALAACPPQGYTNCGTFCAGLHGACGYSCYDCGYMTAYAPGAMYCGTPEEDTCISGCCCGVNC